MRLAVCMHRFTASIDAINERMKAYAVLHKQVDFVECGEAFREASEQVRAAKLLVYRLIFAQVHGLSCHLGAAVQ